MPELNRLVEVSRHISGSAYEKWLMEPVFDAFSNPPHRPITRADAVELKFPNTLALSRLNNVLKRLHVRHVNMLAAIPAADLAAVRGVGEKQLLAATVVLEAYGYNFDAVDRWIDSLDAVPHRSWRAAAADAARTGKKRRHEA